jgi:hypothetical protein
MKKYIKPAVEVIEMEISSAILENSFGMYDTATEESKILESRRRGDAWSSYDGIE